MIFFKLLIQKLYFKCFPDVKDMLDHFESEPLRQINVIESRVHPIKFKACCYMPKRPFIDGWITADNVKNQIISNMKNDLRDALVIEAIEMSNFDDLMIVGTLEVLPNYNQDNKIILDEWRTKHAI